MTRKDPQHKNNQKSSGSSTSSEGKKAKNVVEGKRILDPPPLLSSPVTSPKAEKEKIESSPIIIANDDHKEETISEEPEIIYQDLEQDMTDRTQEIEVLQSIYGEDFLMVGDQEFEIKIKGNLNYELPSNSDIANNYFSISEIPYKLSHVGLKLCVKYVSGYPSQTLPKFKCIPLIDLDVIMSLVKSTSQVYAQLGLKKQMQQNEINQIYEKIRSKSSELLGFAMIYSFIQEIEEYLESNNVELVTAEEQFQLEQKEKKILKTSVILTMVGNASTTSDNVLDVPVIAKYKHKKEEPEEEKKKKKLRENVRWENIQNFKAKNKVSIESYIKVEASYIQRQITSNFWMNRYGHAVASNGNYAWLSFGGIHEGRCTSDLVSFNDSGNSKVIPIKELINPRVFHTLTYIVSAEIFVILGGMSENNDYYADSFLFVNQYGIPNIQRLPTFPHKIAGHTASNYEDKLLVFGGFDGENYFNQLYSLTLRKPSIGHHPSSNWIKNDSPKGPSPRCGCASVVFRDILYVYGGNNGIEFFDDLYAFDLQLKYWTKIVTFGTSTALSYSQLFATSNHTLTIIGGISQQRRWNNIVLEFDIGRSTMSALKCDQVSKKFDERIPLCSVLQDNQNFVYTGGVSEKSLNFLSLAKISQSAPILAKNIPDKVDSIRKMTKRYAGSSEHSRTLFDVYYDMITSQIEKNSDLIINYYSKDENGCTEHQKIYAHQFVAISNPVFRRLLAIQNVRDRLNQQDYQYSIDADEENVLSFKNVYLDIQTFKGFEELTFNSIYACLQFVYSYSYDPELTRTDKECLELYEAAKKFKLTLLCEMLSGSISSESLKLTIGDFIEQSMQEFLKPETVGPEEQYFLNNGNEFEAYLTEQTKDTPYVRIVAPDLYSKLDLDRARYLKSIREQSLEDTAVPEEIPEVESFDEELFEEIDSAKGEGFNWTTDVPKSADDLPDLEWKYIIVHKSILVYRSKFFRTMFNMDFSESKTNEIRLNDTSIQSIEAILYWMYSGKFPTILSENAIELFVASGQYDLPEVRDWARSFIEKFIDINNVLTILDIADMIGDVNLKRFCTYYIANRYDIVSRDPAYNDIPFNTKFEIKSIYSKICRKK